MTAPRVFEAGGFQRLTDSGTVFSMAVSPDGRYVAYGQRDGNESEVWIRQAAVGSNVRIVPPTDARIAGLAFSPDGNFVYYSQYPPGSNVATLYKMPALGGDAIPVIDDVDSGISFSPDGTQFSFLRGRGTEGKVTLMTAGVDGGSVRSIAVSSPPKMFFPQRAPWSPDGRTLVASAHLGLGGKESLEAVDVVTGTRTPFGGDWADVEGVTWMPDGKSVLIVGADQTSVHIQLWQVEWPGGSRRQATSGLNDYEAVGLSADGRTAVALETESRSNIWVQDLAGGPARPITSNVRGSAGDAGIAWTPDDRLVYSSFTENFSLELWMMNRDGSHAHRLTSKDAATPAVSPDDKWIYFASSFANTTAGESAIWRLPLKGGEPMQVTPGGMGRQARPVISPDGKWLYFTTGDGARFRAMKMSTDGGEVKVLTKPELSFRVDQVTPDGARLLGFAIDPSQPERGSRPAMVSVDGGAPDFPDNLRVGRLLPDGASMVYEDQRGGTTGLFLRPLAGGPERKLVDLGQDTVVWRLAITNDGKTLAFVRGRDTSDVVLIKAK